MKNFMKETAKDLGYSLWYKVKKFMPVYAAFWGAAWSINQIAWATAPQAAPAIFLGFNLISMPILCYYGARCILAKVPAREKDNVNDETLNQNNVVKENTNDKVNAVELENQQGPKKTADVEQQDTLKGHNGSKRSVSDRKVERIKNKRRIWLRNVRLLKMSKKRDTKEAA